MTSVSKKVLDKALLNRFIKATLLEDVGGGDHTSQACIPAKQKSRAKLLVKGEGLLAGVEVAKRTFQHLDKSSVLDVVIDDGQPVKHGDIAFYLTCNTRALLKGERIVLNTMQHLSGIATLSKAFYERTRDFEVVVLDTRKTTPLLRFLEKWAVSLGGCKNYRDGLYDRIMIKDNHVEAAGSITKAVERVQSYLRKKGLDLDMTIEVRNMAELDEVLGMNLHTRVMLDNFDIPTLRKAVNRVSGRLETEASGGIKLNNIRKIARTGVDFISVGALTHSAQSLDLSLKIIK